MFNIDFIKDLLNDEFLFSLWIHLWLQFSFRLNFLRFCCFFSISYHCTRFLFIFLLVNGIIYFVNFFKWQSLYIFLFYFIIMFACFTFTWFTLMLQQRVCCTADELLQLQLDFLLISACFELVEIFQRFMFWAKSCWIGKILFSAIFQNWGV